MNEQRVGATGLSCLLSAGRRMQLHMMERQFELVDIGTNTYTYNTDICSLNPIKGGAMFEEYASRANLGV